MNEINFISARFSKIVFVSLICSVLSFVWCFSQQINEGFQMEQWLLPFFYSLCLLVAFKIQKTNNSIALTIMLIIMDIRYILTPIYFYIDGPETSTYYASNQPAVFLMIFEMISVIVAIEIYLRRNERRALQPNRWLPKSVNSFWGLGTLIIVLLLVLVIIGNPQYLKNLFNFNFNGIEEIESQSSIAGFYNLIYKTGLITIGCFFIELISKGRARTGITARVVFSLMIAVLFTWLAAQGTSGGISRTSFLSYGLIYGYILYCMYPTRRKFIFSISFPVIALFIVVGTMIRFSYGSELSTASISNTLSNVLNYKILNSYFGGVENVAIAIQTKIQSGNQIGLSTFICDLVSPIPFVATRIGLDFSNRTAVFFNDTLFGNTIHSTSRIIPIIGQGYIYLGALFSSAFSVMMVTLSFKVENKIYRAQNVMTFFAIILLTYYLSAFMMYNLNIISNGFWNKVIPLLCVSLFNKIHIGKRMSGAK